MYLMSVIISRLLQVTQEEEQVEGQLVEAQQIVQLVIQSQRILMPPTFPIT